MKIRNGFVSNSSSSSFIVAVDNEEDTKVKVSVDVDLKDYGTVIRNIEELDEYFKKRHYIEKLEEMDEYLKESYNNCKNVIHNGKIIVDGSFSSEGDPLESFLCENGLGNLDIENKVKIIESDGY